MEQDMHDAGFRSTNDPDDLLGPVDAANRPSRMVRLAEIRQLIIPYGTTLPEQLSELTRSVGDLVELGHALYEADKADLKIIILLASDAVALAAFQFPTLFRLKCAVVRGIPGADYSPLFNQATYGLNEVSWGYLVDTLHLDDRLTFDVSADVAKDDGYRNSNVGDELDAGDGNEA